MNFQNGKCSYNYYLIIKQQISALMSFLHKLAKRRASSGYARDRGFGSSRFLDCYEKFVLSRFHGRYRKLV